MTRSTKTQSINPKSSDPETEEVTTEATEVKTILGTLLLLISGGILYADKVLDYFDIQITYDFKYYGSLDVFIWTLSGTVAPIMILAAFWFNPKRWAIAAPLAAYSVQLMYIFQDEEIVPKDNFWYYTLGFILKPSLKIGQLKIRIF